MFELRDYQKESVKNGLEVMQGKPKKSMIVIPTGGGKSLTIAKIVEELNKPVLILQPSKELLVQNYKKYRAFGGKATVCCASLKEKVIDGEDMFKIEPGEWIKNRELSDVTFATPGTVKKYIDELKDIGVKHVIVDEIHIGSKSNSQMRKLFKQMKVTHVLGLTATPLYLEGGMDGSRLVMINRAKNTMFKDVCHLTQIKELVDREYWSPLKYEVIDTDTESLVLNTSGADYTDESIKKFYSSNNIEDDVIVKIPELIKSGREKIIVFVPSIDDAESLNEKLNKIAKVKSKVVHSNMSTYDRNKNIKNFDEGKLKVLVNVSILGTGYDSPRIDCIINTRPTSSISLYYQHIGRSVRLHPDKKDALIVDYSGNVNFFGKVEDLHFDNVENYGWGLFNGRNELLTDYPIRTKNKPTKESLINHKEHSFPDLVFYFGKYKGKSLDDVYKNDKSYLVWIVDQETFTWYGVKGKKLRDAIFNKLKLPVPEGHLKSAPPPYTMYFSKGIPENLDWM